MKPCLGPNTPEISLGGAPETYQRTSGQSSVKSVKRETPDPIPTPIQFPQRTSRKRVIRQVPDDIIDLTLDSSDVEHAGTPDQRSSTKVSENVQSASADPHTLGRSSSEITSSNPSANEFSMGSTIPGPPLDLAKKPHDKPRLFVRYRIGSEARLANISAHGFVDQICIVPQW